MGDARFDHSFEKVRRAADRAAALRALPDDDVVQALAAASRAADPLLANILATEALNRMRHARVALEHLGEGVCILDMEERVLMANPAACRMLRTTREELLGMRFHRHEQTAQGCRMVRSISEAQAVHFEDEIFWRADDTSFPVAYTAAPILIEGHVDGIALVFNDISERHRHEQALRASEARGRALADATREAIVIHVNSQIVMVNRAALDMFAVDERDIIGRSIFQFVAPGSADEVREAVREGHTEPMIATCVRADGTTFIAEAHARPFDLGDVTARAVAIRDITAARAAARKLELSEQRYRSLFEASPVAMFSVDPQGRITGINPALTRLTGVDGERWKGRGFISLVDAASAEDALTAFARVLRGETQSLDFAIRTAEGKMMQARVTSFPIRVDGLVEGVYGFVEPVG